MALSKKKKSFTYLLGDSKRESARLRAQARLWDPIAHALFDRLGVRKGWNVLELGPGQGSLHLELRRRVGGPIDAVERSQVFAEHLRKICARDGFGDGKIWNMDLIDAPLPKGKYDLIFARMVFLFLPDPEAHLRKLVKSLKPGGRIAIQDYHRETLGMIPRPEEWPDFVSADRSFFASQGGDASIGGRLPTLFEKVGLRVTETVPNLRISRPGSPSWKWMSDYFLGIMDRYAEFPPFTPAKAKTLKKKWVRASKKRESLLLAPTLLDIVGQR